MHNYRESAYARIIRNLSYEIARINGELAVQGNPAVRHSLESKKHRLKETINLYENRLNK